MNKILKIYAVCFFVLLNFSDCKKSPTEIDENKSYTYYEGQRLQNTEYFFPLGFYDFIFSLPNVSPNGEFLSYRRFYNIPVDSIGIYVMSLGTGTKRLLLNDILASSPAWSPDGEWIAFNLNRHIYKIGKNGENLTQLTFPTSYFGYSGSEFDADWSPDGKKIAYRYDIDYRSGVKWGVYTMNNDGGQKLWLYPAGEPDWHPSGTKMIVSKGILDLTSGKFMQVFDSVQDQFSPQFSPDGNRIVFWNEKGIWILNSDGTGVKRILPFYLDEGTNKSGEKVGLYVMPGTWCPDGKYLIYEHFKITRFRRPEPNEISTKSLEVEGYFSFYKVNVDSAIAISNLP